jgi:hypothetical protein
MSGQELLAQQLDEYGVQYITMSDFAGDVVLIAKHEDGSVTISTTASAYLGVSVDPADVTKLKEFLA